MRPLRLPSEPGDRAHDRRGHTNEEHTIHNDRYALEHKRTTQHRMNPAASARTLEREATVGSEVGHPATHNDTH